MVFPYTIITQSPQETTAVGRELAAYLMSKKGSGAAVCLYGDLGSGKTTFVQGLAHGLGVTGRLLSPTFIIVRRYQLSPENNFFYHIDLYRLSSESELKGLGLSEIFSIPGSIAAIEWADKLGTLLPPSRIDVKFSLVKEGHKIETNNINL